MKFLRITTGGWFPCCIIKIKIKNKSKNVTKYDSKNNTKYNAKDKIKYNIEKETEYVLDYYKNVWLFNEKR